MSTNKEKLSALRWWICVPQGTKQDKRVIAGTQRRDVRIGNGGDEIDSDEGTNAIDRGGQGYGTSVMITRMHYF